MSEVAQLCPILRNPMDCSLPGSSVHGIFQARVLEWVAISFSKDIEYIVNNNKKKAVIFRMRLLAVGQVCVSYKQS